MKEFVNQDLVEAYQTQQRASLRVRAAECRLEAHHLQYPNPNPNVSQLTQRGALEQLAKEARIDHLHAQAVWFDLRAAKLELLHGVK